MGLFSGIGSFFGPIGSILGGIGDDLLGRSDAEETNATNVNTQRMLRQTAYQDTTADLKAAGLNPMLAYSNGATASANPNLQNKGISSAQQNSAQATAANINADTENKNAQRDLMEAQAAEIRSKIPVNTNTAANVEQQTKQLVHLTDKAREEIQLVIKQTYNEVDRGNLLRAQEQLANVQSRLAGNTMTLQDAQAELHRITSKLKRLEVPGMENSADFEKRMGETLRAGGAAGTAAKTLGGLAEIIKRMQK